MNRRAETHSPTRHAATVILLIILLIISYIIVVPEETQEEILGEELNRTVSSENPSGNVLLLKTIGRLEPFLFEENVLRLSSVDLFSKSLQSVEKIATSVVVSRTFLTNNDQELAFSFDTLDDLQEVQLVFNILELTDDLLVYLNDNLISRGPLSANDLPLILPLSLFQTQNTLRFEVASPAWRILSKNYFRARDVTLILVNDFEHQKERRNFELDNVGNFKKATLSYFVNCLNDKDGDLTVELNGELLDQSLISCDARVTTHKLPLSRLTEGTNSLIFSINQGEYRIESLEISLDEETLENPTYYFSSSQSGRGRLNLEFSNDGTKRATLLVNGERFSLTEEGFSFSRQVVIREGENYIKIIPLTALDIASLKVEL